MKTIQHLRKLGYRLEIDGDTINAHYEGDSKPAPDVVKPLFENLRENKQKALQYLQSSGENLMDQAVRYLSDDGRVLLYSSLLQENIVVLENDQIEVPREHADKASYTLDELKQLVADPPDPEELRFLHETKKTFPGSRLTDNDKGVMK